MADHRDCMRRFQQAAGFLPERLWRAAFTLSEGQRLETEEFRIRLGRQLTAVVGGQELPLGDEGSDVTADELDELLARATQSSVHTYNEQIKNGFITLPGGHRLGLCGELVLEDGRASTMRQFSSMNLRVAKEFIGLSEPLLPLLAGEDGNVESTLILAPPGGGKTTLLRDLVRAVSLSCTVALADERGEVAAAVAGRPQFCIGRSDVLTGGAKHDAVAMLLRAMSPRVIALDEITCREDAQAVAEASYTGCRFLTTAHGAELGDLYRRPVYAAMMEQDLFRRVIRITVKDGKRNYQVYRKGGTEHDQADWSSADCGLLLDDRFFHERGAVETGGGAEKLFVRPANHPGGGGLSAGAGQGYSGGGAPGMQRAGRSLF